MSRRPAGERGRLARDALALGRRLQDGWTTVCCSAADDDGHAPPLDERNPLEVPALGEIVQHSRQHIEPRVDRASESTSEAPAQFLIELGNAGCGHRLASMAR